MWRTYGKDWDWWENHLTLPLYNKLADDLMRFPPAERILAWAFKYPTRGGRTGVSTAPPKPMMGFPEQEP